MNFFRAVGCVTGLKQLDFGGDPDHLGIREFFAIICGVGELEEFCGMSCLAEGLRFVNASSLDLGQQRKGMWWRYGIGGRKRMRYFDE